MRPHFFMNLSVSTVGAQDAFFAPGAEPALFRLPGRDGRSLPGRDGRDLDPDFSLLQASVIGHGEEEDEEEAVRPRRRGGSRPKDRGPDLQETRVHTRLWHGEDH